MLGERDAAHSLRLAKLAVDATKCVVQIRAKAIDDGNDRDRDPGSDKTIFNRGRGRFVLCKALQ